MGRLVDRLAGEQGHDVGVKLTSRAADLSAADLAAELRSADVAIDFSVAPTVLRNIEACAIAGGPLVEGTTGWLGDLEPAKQTVAARKAALVYGANFSAGVQVFYRVAAKAAELFRALEPYDPFIEEAHHKRKRDAPSGTALQLEKVVTERLGRPVPVTSTRAGYIPGTHRLGFDSNADQITVTHIARSREGFAGGALLAARWIVGREGVYEFSEVFDEIVKTP